MTDIVSASLTRGKPPNASRRDWWLIVGIVFSVLAVAYLAAALHARNTATHGWNSASDWLPLQLFVIAIAPALAGFIFLWSERHLHNRQTQRYLRNLGFFGFGLFLAAWVAFVAR